MAGFRDYLPKHFTPAQLQEMGIASPEDFDYGQYLRAKGITAQSYRSEHGRVPLIREFQQFQNERMIERITEVFEYAEQLRGKPLVRSINSSASSPRTLIPAPAIDYFCGEVDHHAAAQQAPAEPVFVYKVVEALQRRQTATASGQDWAWIKANEKPGLVRLWIAQAYAFGSVFMAPHHQWCYTQELGTHWWDGKPEDFAWLYRFVRDHASRLEGYRSLADTAVIYSGDFNQTRAAAQALTEANIPFLMLVAGNSELPLTLPEPSLAPVKNLIAADPAFEQRHADELRDRSFQRLEWRGVEHLPEELRSLVQVEGAESIRVSLRYHPETGRVVCHVLNQNYDPVRDDVTPADVTITLATRLLDQAGVRLSESAAVLYTPRAEPRKIDLRREDETVVFELKNAGGWSLVELGR
jgi:hypothetical protein